MKVPAGVTVVAVLIGGTLLGIVGALIAIPAAAALHLLTQELPVPISTRRDQLAAVARRRVLFRSLRCIRMACTSVVMRQMRLIRRRQKSFAALKLGGFAMVPCCVLMMFSRLSF